MDGFKRAISFDPGFPAYQEEDSGSNKHHRTDARVQRLDAIGEVVELELAYVEEQAQKQRHNRDAQYGRGGPESQMRALDPFGALDGLLGQEEQLRDDVAQAALGKTLLDPDVQGLDGVNDPVRIKAPECGRGGSHASRERVKGAVERIKHLDSVEVEQEKTEGTEIRQTEFVFEVRGNRSGNSLEQFEQGNEDNE